MIFETMVFGGELVPFDQEMQRYSTEAEAISGHDQWAARIRDALAVLVDTQRDLDAPDP